MIALFAQPCVISGRPAVRALPKLAGFLDETLILWWDFSVWPCYPSENVPRRPSNKRGQEPKATENDDVVLLCGASADGRGVDVLRKRGNSVQAGVVRPLEEGKPLQGEVVQLVQRGQSPLFDVAVRFDPKAVGANAEDAAAALSPAAVVPAAAPVQPSVETRGHPPRVATDDYRKNWDAIWKRPASKQLLN
jgi:hypothetical protein